MTKKWLKSIFNKTNKETTGEWRKDDSIYQFLLSHINNDGKLSTASQTLPDQDQNGSNFKLAPGLIDAMFGAENSAESKKSLEELVKHVRRVAIRNDKKSDFLFYKLITEDVSIIGLLDHFQFYVSNESLPVDPFLFQFAKDLTTKSGHRNAVKFGITLLDLCQAQSAIDEIKIMGLHDEFTLYASVAIAKLSMNAEDDLWELAQKVNGWGKIQLVERLAALNLNANIKEWLIIDGYKNEIMNEYLAYTCAMNGELHLKLSHNDIDKNLYKASVGLLNALITNQSPADDITNYPFAAQVISDFLRHSLQYASDVEDLNLLLLLKDYLTEILNDEEEQYKNGWTPILISDCIIDTVGLLNGRNWEQIVIEGLKENDKKKYVYAKQSAYKLGIDFLEIVWDKLEKNPDDSTFWYDITNKNSSADPDRIIAFAIKNLPLKELKKNKGEVNENYQKYLCLDLVIQYLENYPTKGEEILLTALACPVAKTRNGAVKVLSKWNKENWSNMVRKEMLHIAQTDADEQTRESVARLLGNENLD